MDSVCVNPYAFFVGLAIGPMVVYIFIVLSTLALDIYRRFVRKDEDGLSMFDK